MRNIPRRRGLAPFVGAALAALTAGSLITFSVIAQRTSLDGMSDDRTIAESPPAAAQPSAITIAPLAAGAGEDDGTTTEPVAEPSGLIPAAPLLTVAGPVDEGPSGATTLGASDDDPIVAAPSDTDRLGGRLAAEEAFLARTGGGSPATDDGPERAGYDGRHDGKHTHKSHEANTASKRPGKAASKKAKRSARYGRSAKGRRDGGYPPRSASSGRGNAEGSAAPAGRASSREGRPAPAAKKSSSSRRPAGNSRSRGRSRH